MTTLLAFVVAIAVLVVFHELGHYAVARMFDVKVLRFSVGFGKVLYTKRFGNGETEWALSAIPLGGYVKMLDEHEGEVPEAELSRAFNRKPVLQRMAIVVAGPVANLLLAIAIGARRQRVPRWVGTLLRYHPTTRTWSMIEVMLLGVMVALIKIAELATVIPGLALFVLGALVFILTWMQSVFDPHEVWERIEWASDAAPRTAADERLVAS